MSHDTSSHKPTTLKPPLAHVNLDQIDDGGAISLDLTFKEGRQSVIVTRRSEVIAAFLNRCPHARWPLDTFDGRFLMTQQGDLICAAHGAIFDALSGACLGGPGTGQGLKRLDVVQSAEGFDIFES
jgi:nitrite reductase/ring-hydroxylating ferredoxin subunit